MAGHFANMITGKITKKVFIGDADAKAQQNTKKAPLY
jgi:hypothetical protein